MLGVLICICFIAIIFLLLNNSKRIAIYWVIGLVVCITLLIHWVRLPWSDCETIDIINAKRQIISNWLGNPRLSYVYTVKDEKGYYKDILIEDTGIVQVIINEGIDSDYLVLKEKPISPIMSILFMGFTGPIYEFHLSKPMT